MSLPVPELPNPYDWRRHRPRVEITRANVEEVAGDLCQGGSGVLLAGRGLGKSVFLRQLHAELEKQPGVVALLFAAPPPKLTVEALIRALAKKLGVPLAEPFDTHEVMEAYLSRDDAADHVVLLYDEFDRYARSRTAPADPPGRDFFNNLESMRRDYPEVGILAAGSIGVFLFRDALGSSFLARADRVRLPPFEPEEVARLARAFAERGRPLDDEILAAVGLMTGGNPALVTYAFQGLWDEPQPTLDATAEIFARFSRSNEEFLRDFQLSFASPELSEAPQRIWELIQNAEGPISHGELRRACVSANGILALRFTDVLDLLEAAGLVRITGSVRADPVVVHPVASILSLPSASAPMPAPDLRERLRRDLETLLARLHAASADFFRPAPQQRSKQLVPESVFASFLALGFGLLGWAVEREAQRAAGRTDLLLSWNGSEERVIVEVKIWGRKDYREAHRQVRCYWSADVEAAAVVMITDAEIADWPAVYRESCLLPWDVEADAERFDASPIRARFATTSATPDEMMAPIDHYLLRLSRRR